MSALPSVAVALLLSWAGTPHAHETGPLHPPLLARHEAPAWPAEEPALHDVTVALVLTVEADGSVSDVEVLQSGGAAFDAAAVVAARTWRFEPGTLEGRPSRMRVKLVQRFVAAPLDLGAAPDAHAPTPPAGTTEARHVHAHAHPGTGVHVHAHDAIHHVEAPAPRYVQRVSSLRAQAPRAAGDFTLAGDVLAAAPMQDATDLLRNAPGVYMAQPEGPAVAPEIFMRGFDASHGQDVEITVDGVPVNQPSHVHGQGYADTAFIIPEVVRRVRVTEGVHDPRQGDFAVAGSAAFELGAREKGIHLQLGAGSFGTLRALMVVAPRDMDGNSFGAVQVRTTQGFGRNRGGQLGSGIGQLEFQGPGGFTGTAHLVAHGARMSLPGILRADDVEGGRVGFYDGYADPSASSQGIGTARTQASVKLARRGDEGSLVELQAWSILGAWRLRQNNTGYTQRSEVNPAWAGRGDLIEQEQSGLSLGGRYVHRLARRTLLEGVSMSVEAGVVPRMDLQRQAQRLLQAPQNETWDVRADATIAGLDLGGYVDLDVALGEFIRLRGGWRANLLAYSVEDITGNHVPAFRAPDHLPGYRRTALGLAQGPRGGVEFRPAPFLPVFISYGEGYRSPQALQLEEGENAPYTKVRSLEGGVRVLSPDLDDRIEMSLLSYVTWLSQDLAFDPQEGGLDKVGPTSRRGATASLVVRPVPWWVTSASASVVHATLDAPPPPSSRNPRPAHVQGQLLPYVPPVVLRATSGVDRVITTVAGRELRGRLSGTATALSSRPLPHGQWADPFLLLDAGASIRVGVVEMGVDIRNLLNARYAQNEYVTASHWDPSAVPSRLPARHLSAGPPRSVMFNAGVQF